MDRATYATLLTLALLWLVHATSTLGHDGRLPDEILDRVGASPAGLLEEPYRALIGPLFHMSLAHLAYNSAVIVIALPLAVRAMGVTKAVTLAYVSSPLAALVIGPGVVLPLAALGVGHAQQVAGSQFVGASVFAYSAVGMAFAAWGRWRAFGWQAFAFGAVVFATLEGVNMALGQEGVFVYVLHLMAFALGLVWALRWGRPLPIPPSSARARAPRTRPSGR